MCSLQPVIIDCLTILGKLGLPNVTAKKEHVESSIKKVYAILTNSSTQGKASPDLSIVCTKRDLAAQVKAHVLRMMNPLQHTDGKSILEYGCLTAALLEKLLVHTSVCSPSQRPQSPPDGVRTAPPGIISIQHRKLAEHCCRVVLYTSVLASLDEEARLYPKMTLVKRRTVIGGRVLELEQHQRHALLASCMAATLPVFKHPEYGMSVRNNLTGEILAAILQLCFSPKHVKGQPVDCNYFRQELDAILNCVEPTVSLKYLLLLKGVAASVTSEWLLPACTALSVRRYLLRSAGDGVRLVVRAGLSAADGDDWRQCEAVAALVARARVQDLEEFYALIGPQVAKILVSEECEKHGSVLRVMSIILAQLMQRSPERTLLHLATPLLHPLLALTGGNTCRKVIDNNMTTARKTPPTARSKRIIDTRSTTSSSDEDDQEEETVHNGQIWEDGCQIDRCVSVLYRTLVCGGGGGEGCTALIASVLCPLIAVAGVPAPCRTRAPATHCIVKHLANARNSSCVDKLLVMAGLRESGESPPLLEGLRIAIGPDGGATVLGEHQCGPPGDTGGGGGGGGGEEGNNNEETRDKTTINNRVKSKSRKNKKKKNAAAATNKGSAYCDDTSLECDTDLQLSEELSQLCSTVEPVITVLRQLKNPAVVKNFYSALPELLNFTICDDQDPKKKRLLLTSEEEVEELLRHFNVVVLVCELLSRLSEEPDFLEGIFQSVAEAAPMLHDLLKTALQHCSNVMLKEMQEGMLLNVVMLLRHMVCGPAQAQQLSTTDWRCLQGLVPTLRTLKTLYADETIQDFMMQLERAILTHGAISGDECTPHVIKTLNKVWAEKSGDVTNRPDLRNYVKKLSNVVRKQKEDFVNEVYGLNADKVSDDDSDDDDDDETLDVREKESHSSISIKNIDPSLHAIKNIDDSLPTFKKSDDASATIKEIGEVSPTIKEIGEASPTIKESDNASTTHKESDDALTNIEESVVNNGTIVEFYTAINDLCSPKVPVRGHALISIAKLINASHPIVLKNKSKLVRLFELNLKDEDSYVYLSAVECYAALCALLPAEILPLLCTDLIGRQSAETRVKLTEVLTRAARRLGNTLPQYKQVLLSGLLTGIRDSDALVRAASLSALGEVCKELRFSVGPIVYDLMAAVSSVVETDDSPEPRRAAVLVVTLLLRGLGGDAIQVLSDVLRDLYRGLKMLASRDCDEIMCTHAMLALTEIDSITRAFLMPKLKLTKQIYVTQPPPKLF